MYQPLVSIIMPSFNSEDTISESIGSVLSQSYINWELIITDDDSSDSTISIIEDFVKIDSRIKCYKLQDNSGAGIARNNSINKSSGRFIAFLDADDFWFEDKLVKQIEYMLTNNSAFTYTYYQKFTKNRDLGIIFSPAKASYNTMLYNNVIGCLTAVYDTNVVGKRYMPIIRKRQDLGLWLDILRDGYIAECVPFVSSKYRIDTGMTKNKFTVLSYQWNFYRETLDLSFVSSIYNFSLYVIFGLVKYSK